VIQHKNIWVHTLAEDSLRFERNLHADTIGTDNSKWSSLFHEQKDMAQYGGYPPLQNCAVDDSPIELPAGDQCPPIIDGLDEEKQPESCALACNREGECHSHNVFGECTYLLDWTLTPKFGEAEVSKVIIFKDDKIKFKAPDNLAHNLFEITNESDLEECNFGGSSNLAGVEETFSGHEVVFDEAGTFYFTCSITSHCFIGQKLTVEVKDASEGLKCHDHDDMAENDLSVPLLCSPGEVNVRAVNNPDYGALSANECSEQCVLSSAAQFMNGAELGSCASLGYMYNPTSKEVLLVGSPLKSSVVVVSNITDSTCHCHSYEEITCAEDDALYTEHIVEIEEHCASILDGSEESCPYKCFQPIEVLHLHYIECSSRVVDATYKAVNATTKCHKAAVAPSGTSDCPLVSLGQYDDLEEDQPALTSSAGTIMSYAIGTTITALVSFIATFDFQWP